MFSGQHHHVSFVLSAQASSILVRVRGCENDCESHKSHCLRTQRSGSGPSASNNVGYAFGDVSSTPLQPTASLCCDVGLDP